MPLVNPKLSITNIVSPNHIRLIAMFPITQLTRNIGQNRHKTHCFRQDMPLALFTRVCMMVNPVNLDSVFV